MRFHTSNIECRVHCRSRQISSASNGRPDFAPEVPRRHAKVTRLNAKSYKSRFVRPSKLLFDVLCITPDNKREIEGNLLADRLSVFISATDGLVLNLPCQTSHELVP